MSDPRDYLVGLGTVRACIDCGALVAGGPTRCVRCAVTGPPRSTPPPSRLRRIGDSSAWIFALLLLVGNLQLHEAIRHDQKGDGWGAWHHGISGGLCLVAALWAGALDLRDTRRARP